MPRPTTSCGASPKLLHAPVTTSWAGRGVLPETNALAMPMALIKLNNEVRNDADVVLILGSRVGETDWWGKAPNWRHPSEQKTIQVDIDGHILGANKPVELAVLADVKLFLAALATELEGRAARMNLDARRRQVAKYHETIRSERAKLDEKLQDMSVPMNPAHIAHICQQVFPEGTTLVADGGNTAVWAMFFHEMRVPNTLLSTFKFGMLGAGVAQALGAAIARPERPVCCIIGDGAMGFHPQEIETAVRNGLQVVYVVACDKQWGMVKMNQQFALKPIKTLIRKSLGPDETIKADLGEIRFDKLAESMGAHGERVADPRELKAALERALAAAARPWSTWTSTRSSTCGHRDSCTSRTCTSSPRANDRTRRGPAALQPGIADRARRHPRVRPVRRRARHARAGLPRHRDGTARHADRPAGALGAAAGGRLRADDAAAARAQHRARDDPGRVLPERQHLQLPGQLRSRQHRAVGDDRGVLDAGLDLLHAVQPVVLGRAEPAHAADPARGDAEPLAGLRHDRRAARASRPRSGC